ncbi:hypothetical protein QJQ45_013470 [Haematococcus lacustris]|nr:hypothetical protein QJQ45_013470 [Haematococcus lacustris]
MNKVMEDMLRHYVGVEYVDWDKFPSSAEFAINNSYNSSIGTTPFRLNNVKDPNVPITLKLDATTNNAAQNFARVMKDNLEKAKLTLDAARKRQKAYYDLMHRDENEIVVGSEVLLRTKHLKFKNPGSPKLLPLYIGPFQVTQKHRKNKQGKDEYLVRWSGYGPEHDTPNGMKATARKAEAIAKEVQCENELLVTEAQLLHAIEEVLAAKMHDLEEKHQHLQAAYRQLRLDNESLEAVIEQCNLAITNARRDVHRLEAQQCKFKRRPLLTRQQRQKANTCIH